MNRDAYYNENDPRAAACLRELIAAGLIAPGDVDTRSISDVKPDDLAPYTQCHFFAGIGGWSLALRLAGVPDTYPVWSGSCPCQPFSAAGKGRGTRDKRHLFPVWKKLIAECGPAILYGEQVASPKGRSWYAGVRADLEALDYQVGAADLCAASTGEEAQGWFVRGDSDAPFVEEIIVGPPHIRQRIYWVAFAEGEGRPRMESQRQTLKRESAWAGRGGAIGGVAQPDGGNSSPERKQRGGQQRFEPAHGGAGGMADVSGGRQRIDRRASRPAGHADQRGEIGEVFGLGFPQLPRPQGHTGHGDHGNQPGWLDPLAAGSAPAASPYGPFTGRDLWQRFDLLPCTDGKARRVEPGTFPLAHGIPGRVGLLRGYGNAIVPQQAADFITDSLGAIRDLEALNR